MEHTRSIASKFLEDFPNIMYDTHCISDKITILVMTNTERFLDDYRELTHGLPTNYLKHIERFYDKNYRLESALCFLMLCEYNSNIDITFAKNGKPYDIHNSVFFSFSHANNTCVCAISTRDIGVDIVATTPFDHACAEVVCSPKELAAFNCAPPTSREFTEFLGRKESYLKLNGGLLKDINLDIDSHTTFYTFAIDDNICVVCERK